jgi:ATP-binding cassette subfamily B protein
MPKMVKEAADDFLSEVKGKQSFDSIFWLSLQLAGIYVLFSVLKGFFLFMTRQMIIIVSRLIEYDLKNEIYVQYQKLNYSFFKRNKTGDLMNRISEDVSQVRMYLGPGWMYTINLVVLFVMVIFTMLKTNVTLTLIVLAPLPIMSILIYRVSNKMNKLSKEVQEEQSLLSTIVQETFSGIRVIKAYIREKEVQTKFNASSEEFKSKNMKLVIVNALFMPTIVFLIGLSTLLTIYYGGCLVIEEQLKAKTIENYIPTFTPGDILAFISYVFMLTWPFASVGWVTSINRRAAASQARINEFLEIKPEIYNSNHSKLDEVKEISFENVTFSYVNSEEAHENFYSIKNLSFTIKEGETLGIVGRTGSGKSTILNLITRQIDPSEGRITVNGQDLREINLDEFRQQLGIVPQDVFLFSDTIGNNIKFGLNQDEVTEEQLIDVTKTAHVYHNIKDFQDGFDTILGERGVNLSGGQKQRVSIARAIIRNPKTLLLDDCLSAVDTETEDIILKGLNEKFKNSLTVIVSHRISSLRFADKIIVIEDGQKVEEGTHSELITRNGIYHEMYLKQLSNDEG